MPHDAALKAHESAEQAEHAARTADPFIAPIAITIAVLAVFAAVAGGLEAVEGSRALGSTSEAVLMQDRATDVWSEFQADSIKRHVYGIAADGGGANADRYRKSVKDYGDTQARLRKEAKDDENDRDHLLEESARHEGRHHWLTGVATLFEVGIAMSTVAIITRRRPLWLCALGFGAIGLVLLGIAYVAA